MQFKVDEAMHVHPLSQLSPDILQVGVIFGGQGAIHSLILEIYIYALIHTYTHQTSAGVDFL